MALERRFETHGELRVKGSGDKRKIGGYAAKFNVLSEDLGYFREQLDPHCFDACLAANPDVRCLWNHDANHILGRTKAGTMRLKTDAVGLDYEVDPPATQLANDLMISMERGDVTQSSFGFIVTDDVWRDDPAGNGMAIRTVLKAELFDCSPVTFPAYTDATSGVRQLRALFPDGADEVKAKIEELRVAREARVAAEAVVVVVEPVVDAVIEPVVEESAEVIAARALAISTETATPVAEVRTEDLGAATDSNDPVDDDEDDCDCDCAACVLGDCSGCTDPDCDDEDCSGCTMRSARSLRNKQAKRDAKAALVAAEVPVVEAVIADEERAANEEVDDMLLAVSIGLRRKV
jgi:hypothetical protein